MIQCSFIKKCENSGKECFRCKFNASLELGNYLLLKDKEGRTVKHLEIQ